jgi:hypothetical protein
MEKTLPRLLSYQHIRPGFEVVINENKIAPGFGGGIWNLWWNVQLSDDPMLWDREIHALNTMQEDSDILSKNHRYVRIHMAEWCRNSDAFPTSLDILCAEIGNEKITTPWSLGCEGRGLRESLGIHSNPDDRLEQRVYLFNSYKIAFKSWINQTEPESLVEAKIIGYLGEMTQEKMALVDLLRNHLNPALASTNTFKEIYKDQTQRAFTEPLTQCLSCNEIDTVMGQSYPKCSCCERFYIDSLLLAQKFSEPNRMYKTMFRFHQECLLAYMFALNAWLIDEEPTLITNLFGPIFVTYQLAEQIPKQVRRLLGARTQVKEWLTGCLLKTLKGNMSQTPYNQMVVEYPEATSWLSFIRV